MKPKAARNKRVPGTIRGALREVKSLPIERFTLAVKSDIRADLTLEIDGKSVTPEKFVRSVRAFFAILQEVSGRISGKQERIEWRVQVREGSNLIGVQPIPGFSSAIVAEVMKAMSEGLEEIEDRAARPKHFTERAIKSLRELADVVGTTTDDDTTVRIWVKKQPIKVTHKSVAHVAELLASGHEDYGSIEGRLRAVTDKGGLHFVVKEPLRNHEVRCFIPESLTETALANFRNRVEVYGVIKYRKDGRAISIDVDDLVPFPPEDSLPSYLDVRGALRRAS